MNLERRKVYDAWVASKVWEWRCYWFLVEAKWCCQRCGKRSEYLKVIHTSHDNLGREELGRDVLVLCIGCRGAENA